VTVHLVSITVWELGAVEYAATCHRLLLALMGAGMGSVWWGPHELMLARMAVLDGRMEESRQYFTQARVWTDEYRHRYLAAIIDYDEALALLRAGMVDRAEFDALVGKALAAFRSLDMEGWARRALALRRQGIVFLSPVSADTSVYPDQLTSREVQVLCLLAGGMTNKEIAERLVVSVPTVARHIANIYTKIDARGRADATAYALRHGLDESSPGA
jgi:DNA-binding NarL/FixJ family response regulator